MRDTPPGAVDLAVLRPLPGGQEPELEGRKAD